jgi:hypothetical protein
MRVAKILIGALAFLCGLSLIGYSVLPASVLPGERMWNAGLNLVVGILNLLLSAGMLVACTRWYERAVSPAIHRPSYNRWVEGPGKALNTDSSSTTLSS